MYGWLCRLRDDSRSDPRVLQFLEQENRSAALHLEVLEDLQGELCDEISSRWGELGLGLLATFNPALGLLSGRTSLLINNWYQVKRGRLLYHWHISDCIELLDDAFLPSCPTMSGQQPSCYDCLSSMHLRP